MAIAIVMMATKSRNQQNYQHYGKKEKQKKREMKQKQPITNADRSMIAKVDYNNHTALSLVAVSLVKMLT